MSKAVDKLNEKLQEYNTVKDLNKLRGVLNGYLNSGFITPKDGKQVLQGILDKIEQLGSSCDE